MKHMESLKTDVPENVEYVMEHQKETEEWITSSQMIAYYDKGMEIEAYLTKLAAS